MNSLEEIRETINHQKNWMNEKFHVNKIGVFGSYARGEATEKSDIDFLVGFSEPIGWEIVDLKNYLESMFHKKVDLVTEPALKARLKDSILSDVIYF
jgi:predicted nucleotidyltransferase